MRILGIDPGLRVTGYSIAAVEHGRIVIIDYGVLKLSSSNPIPERLNSIYSLICNKIQEFQITACALETPFLGKNAHSFMKLAYVRGILYLAAERHALALHEFSPSEVKRAVVGSGSADKYAVARTLMRLFPGLSVPHTLDATDAIAVSLCGIWRMKYQSLRT